MCRVARVLLICSAKRSSLLSRSRTTGTPSSFQPCGQQINSTRVPSHPRSVSQGVKELCHQGALLDTEWRVIEQRMVSTWGCWVFFLPGHFRNLSHRGAIKATRAQRAPVVQGPPLGSLCPLLPAPGHGTQCCSAAGADKGFLIPNTWLIPAGVLPLSETSPVKGAKVGRAC